MRRVTITEVYEHSVDLSMINLGSRVVDLGCRSLGWSKAMLQHVGQILAVDADESIMMEEKDGRISFLHAAVWSNSDQPVQFIKFGNGTGNYVESLKNNHPGGHTKELVATVTLDDLIELTGGLLFDLIKMDIEGAEIEVLSKLKAPPARQLTVEFHLHTGTSMTEVAEVVQHLRDIGYEVIQHELTKRHGLGANFWDSLFILKNIL